MISLVPFRLGRSEDDVWSEPIPGVALTESGQNPMSPFERLPDPADANILTNDELGRRRIDRRGHEYDHVPSSAAARQIRASPGRLCKRLRPPAGKLCGRIDSPGVASRRAARRAVPRRGSSAWAKGSRLPGVTIKAVVSTAD